MRIMDANTLSSLPAEAGASPSDFARSFATLSCVEPAERIAVVTQLWLQLSRACDSKRSLRRRVRCLKVFVAEPVDEQRPMR